ncbi:MAG: glycosyltransferase family 4 protein [Kiritimatiellaeota bacterium]|nr:glycosyltransferase family 4 protein [Kiritimatiellota bacterium]
MHFFPVDADRDAGAFLRAQAQIDRGGPVSARDEEIWIRNSVNSRALCDFLKAHGGEFDRILTGPYLFGVTYHVAQVWPQKTFLVPCLHDEVFAYLGIMRGMFGSVAGCLFNSEPERGLAQRLYSFPAAKSAVVGMGLDAFEADPTVFAKRHGLTPPYVMYSGRREAGKGTPLLCAYLHAFRERTGRDLKLVCTGSGPIEAPPEFVDHILDLGFVSEQEKREAMAGAVTFIHPSVNESFGIVLLEAWLARTPGLVHAKSAVLRWQCQQSNGGLWFRHYPDFEEALLRLLDDPALRRTLGANGRAYVERAYAWPAVEQRLFQALDTPG